MRCVFFGLGADGTVGANKNSVQILERGLETGYAQAYFDYDSHKSGGETASYPRLGSKPISAPYPIHQASFARLAISSASRICSTIWITAVRGGLPH